MEGSDYLQIARTKFVLQYDLLCNFWNPVGDFSLVELENGFYLFKCDERALLGGP